MVLGIRVRAPEDVLKEAHFSILYCLPLLALVDIMWDVSCRYQGGKVLNCEFFSSDKNLISLAGVSAPMIRIVDYCDLNHEENDISPWEETAKKQLLSWSDIY